MIALGGSGGPDALGILDKCLESPPDNELLPLLALSVLATHTPFSGNMVGTLACGMAERFAATGNRRAAEAVMEACAVGLERCGAFEPAADLREAQALLRLKARLRK